jgi:hypothetical protein
MISFFAEEQILFPWFAYFIFMIYVEKLELIQVASMVRYHTILAVRFSYDYLNVSAFR